MSDSVALSIVVPTSDGLPLVAEVLASVRAAAARVDGELIVVDGSGRPAPDPREIGPSTRWLSVPGGSVFQLRLHGYRNSRGAVVAATEDHCVAPLDWAEKILAAHSEWGDAAVVGGALENGSTARLLDWASFFVNAVASMPPVRRGPTRAGINHANISYKRGALASIDDNGGLGIVEFLHVSDLRRRGALTYVDDRIRIAHVQSLGTARTTAAHFHAGRLVAFQRRRWGFGQRVRMLGCFVIPLVRLARITRIGMTKPHRRQLVASLPWITWLLYVQAAGRFVGYVRGLGDSPRKIA